MTRLACHSRDCIQGLMEQRLWRSKERLHGGLILAQPRFSPNWTETGMSVHLHRLFEIHSILKIRRESLKFSSQNSSKNFPHYKNTRFQQETLQRNKTKAFLALFMNCYVKSLQLCFSEFIAIINVARSATGYKWWWFGHCWWSRICECITIYLTTWLFNEIILSIKNCNTFNDNKKDV